MNKHNNKGTAMVTVLIAITFISILASSLLYMSYINFMTKSARIYSNDNFYTDELVLNEISSGIENVIVKETTVENAIKKIEDEYKSDATHYDPAKLNALVNIANQDASVVVTSGNPLFERNGNEITFKNVVMTTKDLRTNEFVSKIETDLTFGVNTNVNDGPDLNDFSIMSDSLLNSDTGNPDGGSLVLTGNLYCRHKEGETIAMNLISGRVVSLMSPLAAIDGDIEIAKHSALIIGGTAVVDGNIKIEDDGILIVTGKLGLTGNIQGESTPSSFSAGLKRKVKGIDKIEIDSKYELIDEPMTDQVLSKHVYICMNKAPVDLGVYAESQGYDAIVDILTDNAQHFKNLSSEKYKIYDPINNVMREVKYGSLVDDASDTYNGVTESTNPSQDSLDNYCGKLIIIGNRGPRPHSSNHVQLKEGFWGSTVISLREVTATETHYSKIDKMPDDAYLKAKEMMLNESSANHPKVQNTKFISGTFDDMLTAMDNILNHGASGAVYRYTIPKSEGSAPTASPDPSVGPSSITLVPVTAMDTDAIKEIKVDDPVRYLVITDVNNNMCYLPTGYLISPYSKEVIAKFFSSVYNAGGAPSPTLMLKNWDKSNALD